ncbi:MAG: hypothetical protein JNJ58_00570 [Chitinophagaceae bacterium]|nr:hypothetical protein [Chitinophagaceae bacterium]
MKPSLKLFILAALSVAVISVVYIRCNDQKGSDAKAKTKSSHHLNMPDRGIESMKEANTQMIIEGTDGSIIVAVGEVTRKKADISIRRDDRIIDQQLMSEKETLSFDYEDHAYTLEVGNIKKPLIGAGKVEFTIR